LNWKIIEMSITINQAQNTLDLQNQVITILPLPKITSQIPIKSTIPFRKITPSNSSLLKLI
jgi:hypothetical protein